MDVLNKLAPKHGWLDLAVITGLLLVVNSMFAATDIGWTKLHPTPWLLVPILMGCRYGFPAGMAGAAVAIIVVSVGFARHADFFIVTLLKVHGYLFAAMAAAGGICGQIQRGFKAQEILLKAQAERTGERLKKLDTDLFPRAMSCGRTFCCCSTARPASVTPPFTPSPTQARPSCAKASSATPGRSGRACS
ncbi:MAG: hypothetical protein EBT61_15010 [Verrucomicrobia bacterium]|nr:hypothetical protein [Verrucomicrobiota bacterium]